MLRQINELTKAELEEYLNVVTGNNLVKIHKITRDSREHWVNVQFTSRINPLNGQSVTTYVLFSPQGAYGSFLANYPYVMVNGYSLSISKLTTRFYRAKKVMEAQYNPFTIYQEEQNG